MKQTGPVSLTIDHQVATIQMDYPERRNAMGPEMIRALKEAIDEITDPTSKVRVAVLTGTGKVFSSGGDMAASNTIVEGLRAGDPRAGDHYTLETHHHPLLRRLRELPFPLITAVNGAAIGMGMGYALLGDLIVAKESGFFVAGFVRVGMTPDMGTSWMLPRLVGSARARELLILGDQLPARQAYDWGLINRVFADDTFWAETMELAQRVAAGPPLALSSIRKLIWDAWRNSHEEHIHQEDKMQLALGRTDDAQEGFQAFLEKRPPTFEGK